MIGYSVLARFTTSVFLVAVLVQVTACLRALQLQCSDLVFAYNYVDWSSAVCQHRGNGCLDCTLRQYDAEKFGSSGTFEHQISYC